MIYYPDDPRTDHGGPYLLHKWLATQAKIESEFARIAHVGGVVPVAPDTVELTGSSPMLEVPSGVALYLPRGASLRAAADAAPLQLDAGAALLGNGQVDTSYVAAFSSEALLLDGSQHYSSDSPTYIGPVRFTNGLQYTGTAIHALAANDGDYISMVRADGLSFDGFYDGLLLEAQVPSTGQTRVNGNEFVGIRANSCIYFIRLVGNAGTNAVDGNTIEAQVQPNTTAANAVRALYCDGEYNRVTLMVWDWDAGSVADTTAIELSATTQANAIQTNALVAAILDSSTALWPYSNRITSDRSNYPPANMLTGSASLTPGALAGNAGELLGSVSVPGAENGDVVIVGVPPGMPQGITILGLVSGSGNVALHAANATTGSLTPVAGTYIAVVVKT